MSFARPLLLLLLLALPLWAWRRRRQDVPAARFSDVTLPAAVSANRWWVVLPPVLRAAALVALVLAAAGPRVGGDMVEMKQEGIAIVVTIDISSSMLAEDFAPSNRLEVAKRQAVGFIRGRTADRIGLVAFAGEALTQVPLTTDYPILMQAVDNLQAGQLEDGTAIGLGVATAANRLRDAPGRSRVLILLTDGVNNRGSIDPRSAARAASVFGIKIYAIGVGTVGMAPVPVGRGPSGLLYENQPVRIDEALLSEMARMTGGRYFRARDAAALRNIYEQIDLLERTTVQSRSYVRYSELFRMPLGLGVLALLGELALLARRAPIP